MLRKGTPLDSREAGIALWTGKRLRRIKLAMARGDDVWSAVVDADFGFRAVKLPKTEQVDASGRFQERMLHIETLTNVFLGLYDQFLAIRGNPAAWKKNVSAMHTWVSKRAQV